MVFHHERDDHGLLLSPNMLPSLFYGTPASSRSNISVDAMHDVIEGRNETPSQSNPSEIEDTANPSRSESAPATELLDLTGKIKRDGMYPSAHGGFGDVWKGVWHQDSGDPKQVNHISVYSTALLNEHPFQVAIKVLRSHAVDAEAEQKMQRVSHIVLCEF